MKLGFFAEIPDDHILKLADEIREEREVDENYKRLELQREIQYMTRQVKVEKGNIIYGS